MHRNLRTFAILTVLAGLGTTPVTASDDGVNDIIGGATSSSASKTTVEKAPLVKELAKQENSKTEIDSSNALGEHADAINHVQLLAGRPLPNSTCRNVIFDARPSLNKRHQLRTGATVSLKMKDLCLVGFRNDSDKRTLVVRLGEAFATLAIVLDPKLFTGYAIAPGQQITVPLRQLPVPALDVSLEVAWEEDLAKPSPRITNATLALKRDG